MHFKYCEIVTGGTHNRGNIIELPNNVTNYTLDYFGKEVVDGFHSLFTHTEDYKLFTDMEGGKKGYKGEVFSNYLFWDMDNENVDIARKDTIELVERLFSFNYSRIQIYFSGNKGFHVLFGCNELNNLKGDPNFNLKVKSICSKIAENLDSFDKKIYDKTRIIRTPNSRHSKTNLYKIELTYDQLNELTTKEIYELAREQKKISNLIIGEEYNKDILELLNNSKIESTISRGVFSSDEIIDGICNGFNVGSRNNGYATIAGLLHSRNISDNIIEAILCSINKNSSTPLSESEISSVVNSISRYPINSDYVEAKDDDIITMEMAGQLWEKNAKQSGEFSLGERYKLIDEVMAVTLLGDLIGVVSNSGVGKSTLTLDFGNEYAKTKNTYNAFISLEMAAHACFFRAATIDATPDENGDVSSKEIAYKLLNDEEIKYSIYKNWNRTLIIDKGSIPIDLIEEYGYKVKEKYGKLGSIVVDYSQYIDGASEIDKALYIARELKNVMKKLNVIGFAAMQCNKVIPNSFTEIEDQHVEGVKAWKQACDYMIGIWKSRDNSKRLHGKFLKTRWGKDDQKFDLIRNGLLYSTDIFIPDRITGGGL